MTQIAVILFNALVIAGCAYVVFWKGQSGWWFALALALQMYTKSACKCGDDDD